MYPQVHFKRKDLHFCTCGCLAQLTYLCDPVYQHATSPGKALQIWVGSLTEWSKGGKETMKRRRWHRENKQWPSLEFPSETRGKCGAPGQENHTSEDLNIVSHYLSLFPWQNIRLNIFLLLVNFFFIKKLINREDYREWKTMSSHLNVAHY